MSKNLSLIRLEWERKMILLLFPLLFLCGGNGYAQYGDLERVSPESQGISSLDVKHYFDAMMATQTGEPHGVMVLRNGKVVGELFPEPFSPKHSHTLFSASKSFVALAVGLAVEENRLRLTDRVVTFFPELLPDTISENLADMTVRDLLTMTSGIHADWLMRRTGASWVRRFLRKEVLYQPGEHFEYDSMVTYMLSAIVQRVTGQKVVDYLRPKIFEPLHITEVAWEESPEGINTGGWGLYLQVESMAKFGQLLLDRGKWNGCQLISESWVDEMTSLQQVTGLAENYGYQVWRCGYPDAYRADGALGQYIIVAPREKMVVAITQANTSNGVAERQLVWDLLRKVKDQPLPESKNFQTLLEAERRYQLPVAKGSGSSKVLSRWMGKEIALEGNHMDWRSIRFEKRERQIVMKVTTLKGEQYVIPLGHGEWLNAQTSVTPPYTIHAVERFKGIPRDFYVAGCYGGEGEVLNIRIRYPNWVSGFDLTFRQEKKGSPLLLVKDSARRNSSIVIISSIEAGK